MASTSNTPSDTEIVAKTERPSNLFNSTTPTNPSTNGDCLSPSSSSTSNRTTPSFLPEMPQWKKDLIQRRKSNVARTLNAGAMTPTNQHQQQQQHFIIYESQVAGELIELSKVSTTINQQQITKSSQQFSNTSKPIMPATITKENNTKQTQNNNSDCRGHYTVQTQISTKDEQDKIAINTTEKEVECEFEKIKRRMGNDQNDNDSSLSNSPTKAVVNADTTTGASLQSSIPSPNKYLIGVLPSTISTQQISLCSPKTRTTTLSPSPSLPESVAITTKLFTPTEKDQTKEDGGIAFAPLKMINIKETTLKEEHKNAAGEPTTTVLSATGLTALQRENEKHETAIEQSQQCISKIVASETNISNKQEIRGIETEISLAMTTTTTTLKSTKSTIGANTSCMLMEQYNQQSHSKNGCERTLSLSYPHLSSPTQQLIKTATVNGCGNSGLNNGSHASHNVKISSKLQNNQFIKNQQNPRNIQTAGKYLKYKSHSIQEYCGISSAGATNEVTATNTIAASIIGSPNKLSSVGITKKMVAIQDTKKTTQNANIHSHHHPQQIIGNATLCSPTRSNIPQQQQLQQQQSQQQTNVNDDGNEDLAYGPGIVSKLRCRYLSLALRESMENQNHCIENLRRATSLNNLLDRDDDDEEVVMVLDDATNTVEELNDEYKGDEKHKHILKNNNSANNQTDVLNVTNVSKKTTIFQKNTNVTSVSNGGGCGGNATNGANNNINRYSCDSVKSTQNDKLVKDFIETPSIINTFAVSSAGKESPRSRHNKRGNDCLKRARSVEALLCEKSQWNSLSKKQLPTCVTIEDKINNARDRLISGMDTMPPKRLQSIISDTERPPPDVVKQKLKIFEASAHRRLRPNIKGEVANKVANYKSIINENKLNTRPILSPTKKVNNKSAVSALDLLGGSIGRKTTGTSDNNTPSSNDLQNTLHSTPISKIPNNLDYNTPLRSATNSDNANLLCSTADSTLRQKLLNKKRNEAIVVADSPLTDLSKKFQMLNVTNEKQQSIEWGGGEIISTTAAIVNFSAEGKEFTDKQQLNRFAKENENERGVKNKNDINVGVRISDTIGTGAGAGASASGGNSGGSGSVIGGSGGAESINDMIVVTDVVDLNDNNAEQNNENNESIKNDRETAVTSADIGDICGSSSSYGVEHDIVSSKAEITTSCDLSDNEHGSDSIKRITKTALDNIARAGTTQQYKFSSNSSTLPSSSCSSSTSSTILKSVALKPNYQTNSSTETILTSTSLSSLMIQSSNITSDNFSINKQISIPRSLYETATIHLPNNQDQIHMEALKQHQLHHTIYSNINNTQSAQSHNNHLTSTYTSPLTSREIEKNRINEMKKTAAASASSNLTGSSSSLLSASVASSSSAAANDLIVTTSLDTVINTKPTATSQSGFNEIDSMTTNNSPLWALRKKRQTTTTNVDNSSMVFNFQNRKEVPDYIENDGVIFRRKRELPKPNESGFVLLGDLSLETSTDTDYDDFSMCPPSPCDVEFEGANIVIDGKSSLRKKSKEATFRVQFNDTLTSTFEYPSEASFVIEDCFNDPQNASGDDLVNAFGNLQINDTSSPQHIQSRNNSQHVAVADEIIPLPIPVQQQQTNAAVATSTTSATKNVLGNLPLGSAPLGFYTPIKAPIDYMFQLGITRVPSNAKDTTKGASDSGKMNGKSTITDCHTSSGINNTANKINGDNGEPESLQYLKPANDDLTVAYSEGTHETDLLY